VPANRVIYLPTGDGICIALLNLEAQPYDVHMQVALGILRRLDRHNSELNNENLRVELRVGINANRDNLFMDINCRRNLAGAGINESQRIMDKADGGQILVGDAIFSILKQRNQYVSAFRSYLATVKHGLALRVHQFVADGHPYVNTEVPSAFKTPADIGPQKGLRSADAQSVLRQGGLKIRVEIGPPEVEVRWARLAKLELKESLTITALIDTGASRTVINYQVAVSCGLRQVGEAIISATGHVFQVPEYAGSIKFPESQLRKMDLVKFVACSLPMQDVACLLGRDVLDRWRITYDGRTGEVQIEE